MLFFARFFGALRISILLAGLSVSALSQAQDTTTLDVGYMPILPVAQLFVMEGEGWTEDAGLDLNLTRFSSGPAMVQALAAGDLDVMYFGIGPAMVARANGVPIKVLAASIKEQIGLVARGEFAALFDEADPKTTIARFTEEQGRKPKIATFPRGSVPDTVLRHWLTEQIGVDLNSVDILAMGADRVQQALLVGAVDAASVLEPILTTAQERDDSAKVIARGDEMLPDQPGAVLAARESVLTEYPKAMRKLLELHIRATQMLKDDPQRAAPHVREFVGKRLVPLTTIEAALKSPSSNYLSNPHEIIDATRVMRDFQARSGTLRKSVDIETLFDTRLYNEVSNQQDTQTP